MLDFGTTVAHAIPGYLGRLFDVFKEEGLDPRHDTQLHTLAIGAEPHTEEHRLRIEEMFGVKAYNSLAGIRRPIQHFTRFLIALLWLQPFDLIAAESQCYGTVSSGRLESGVKLPGEGPNFTSYSTLGTTAGRTYVHSKVAEIIVSAYAALAREKPSITYVYGETGWSSGGRIRPHRTHRNGLSVDFFVPVRNAAGESVPLSTSVANKLGYDIEFNVNAKYEEYSIDFEATAEHLYQLHVAAKVNGAGIALVIFDTGFLPKLFATTRGTYLQKELPFMKGKPWVRHDEHYHVDFRVPCKPNAG